MFHDLFQPTNLVLISLVAIFIFGRKKMLELVENFGDAFRGGPKGGSPMHPVPVTGSVETSHGIKGESSPNDSSQP